MKRGNTSARIQVPYYNLILGVKADEAVCAKLQIGERAWPRGHEELVDSTLTIHLDPSGAEFGLFGAYGDERLHWFERDATEDGLLSASWIGGRSQLPSTYLIWELMPYRKRSSGAKSSGRILADKSLDMPACLPLRKLAIVAR